MRRMRPRVDAHERAFRLIASKTMTQTAPFPATIDARRLRATGRFSRPVIRPVRGSMRKSAPPYPGPPRRRHSPTARHWTSAELGLGMSTTAPREPHRLQRRSPSCGSISQHGAASNVLCGHPDSSSRHRHRDRVARQKADSRGRNSPSRRCVRSPLPASAADDPGAVVVCRDRVADGTNGGEPQMLAVCSTRFSLCVDG